MCMLKVLLSYSLSSFFLGLFGVNWDAIDQKIEKEYPGVTAINSAELQTQLSGPGQSPVLIDVREPEEFRVSHLDNALNIPSAKAVAAEIPDKETPIVVYCSVGYRSAGVAAELEQLGYTRVRNLQHSIFAWAESGLPLRNGQGPTNKVHPYNRTWGSLVNADLHAYEPE